MGSKLKEVNIWELAIQESKRKLAESDNTSHAEHALEHTVLVLGGEQSGKSQLIARFMDRDEANIKTTTALDYSYVRKSKSGTMNHIKDVGHIYEIGGGLSMTQLMDVVITMETVRKLSLVLVLDLSKPNELWETQDKLLSKLRDRINIVIGELGAVDQSASMELKSRASQLLQETSKDKQLVNPFPVQLIIIGSKFDLFQHFEPEKKKMVCRALRFLANANAASLYFLSVKGEALTSRIRAIFSSVAFKSSSLSKSTCLDHNRLLSVPFGEDSFEQIGLPPAASDVIRSSSGSPLDLWTAAYESLFPPQRPSSKKANIDPVRDPQFTEEVVDSMRSQKNEELERFKKLHERKARELDLAKGN